MLWPRILAGVLFMMLQRFFCFPFVPLDIEHSVAVAVSSLLCSHHSPSLSPLQYCTVSALLSTIANYAFVYALANEFLSLGIRVCVDARDSRTHLFSHHGRQGGAARIKELSMAAHCATHHRHSFCDFFACFVPFCLFALARMMMIPSFD